MSKGSTPRGTPHPVKPVFSPVTEPEKHHEQHVPHVQPNYVPEQYHDHERHHVPEQYHDHEHHEREREHAEEIVRHSLEVREEQMGILGNIEHAIEGHEHEEHHEAFLRGYEKAKDEAREEFVEFAKSLREHVHAMHEIIKDKFGD